jgi:hypothetical protein
MNPVVEFSSSAPSEARTGDLQTASLARRIHLA